jgi:hypothetical protein
VPRAWKETVVHRLNEFDFFNPGYPQFSAASDSCVHLDDELVEAKVDALRAHESQMEPLFEAYGEDYLRSILSTEVFRTGVRPDFRSRVLQDLKHA